MDEQTHNAIAYASHRLTVAAYIVGPDDEARIRKDLCEIVTGIAAVDSLFRFIHAGIDTPRNELWRRAEFLRGVIDAAGMSGTHTKERQKKASDTAQHLRDAAGLLAELDNTPTAEALCALASGIEKRGADGRLRARMDTDGIAPGMRVLMDWERLNLGGTFSSKRGASSRRADTLRFLAGCILGSLDDRPDGFDSAMARLLREVLGGDCTEANVGQALNRQTRAKAKRADQGADLQSDMNAWTRKANL